MAGTAQDVTERKQLDELRDNILAAVSHELTPLSVLGIAITLRERGETLSDEDRSAFFEHLSVQAGRLDRLLSDLLDIDRLRRLRPPNVRSDRRRRARRGDRGGCEADGRTIEVRVDTGRGRRIQVERIVENLLANAVKYAPAGSAIRVRVERVGDAVLLAVDDRGPGVLEEERELIFGVFNRGAVPAGVPGVGIGLSLVAQFAALHGGRAWVEDNPEGGASFRVLLPATNAPTDQVTDPVGEHLSSPASARYAGEKAASQSRTDANDLCGRLDLVHEPARLARPHRRGLRVPGEVGRQHPGRVPLPLTVAPRPTARADRRPLPGREPGGGLPAASLRDDAVAEHAMPSASPRRRARCRTCPRPARIRRL